MINSERQDLISQFVTAINEERDGKKYRKVTGREIAVKLSHVKDLWTLYAFYSECRDYRNRNGSFGKCFFGSLKIKNETTE